MRWPWRTPQGETTQPPPQGEAKSPPGGEAKSRPRRPRRLWRAPRQQGLTLVKVAYARNIAEAEMIQGLLRGEGIPSMVRRNGGFDVPDFLAAGPRDVLVPASQERRARELLP